MEISPVAEEVIDMHKKMLAKTLLDISKYTILVGLIALILGKLNWKSGISLAAIAVVAAVIGIYVHPGDERQE